MIKKILYLLITLTSLNIYAETLIIEPEMGREPLLQAIHHSKQSIQLVMYGFTDKTLLHAINKQQKAGKSVKMILEKKPYMAVNANKKTIQALKRYGIEWHPTPKYFNLTHQKTLLIDDNQAIIMTFNFTHSAFDKQRNFALIIDNPDDINEIQQHFQSDWQQKTTTSHSPRLIWSPDNSREKLTQLIHSAKKEIDIYAQSIQDKQIIQALRQAMVKGIKVNILTSKKLNSNELTTLKQAGASIKHSKKLYIHAKVFIIDKQKAVIGSINLTRNSIDRNRELSVLTTDANVIHQLMNTFNKDFG